MSTPATPESCRFVSKTGGDGQRQEVTDVLIVGAGPSGLSLAAELRRRGVSVLIVDKQPQSSGTSRAAVVHARTLEVLEAIGATELLLAEGLRVPTFRVRDRDEILLSVDFSELKTRYPYTLMCPQDRTEHILLSRLEAFGGSVERLVEFVGLDRDEHGVIAHLVEAGKRRTVRAKWLVGCDGAHSAVREHSGIEFAGSDYQESFILADVLMRWPLPRDEVNLFFAPDGLVVVAPLPEDRFRIVATTPRAPECPSASFVQSILDVRGPAAGCPTIKDLIWSSRFNVQHRLAATMTAGHVLLCGDAAHVHSPAGGQGMNIGIQDAISLAAAICAAIGHGGTQSLTKWALARRQTARGVVGLTDRITRAATLRARPSRILRNTALRVAGNIPAIGAMIAHRLSELNVR